VISKHSVREEPSRLHMHVAGYLVTLEVDKLQLLVRVKE
jgi:hypothetical protein